MSRETSRRLQQVMAAVDQMGEQATGAVLVAQQVAAMTKEQEGASESMVGAVLTMAEVADSNAVASAQIAASIEEQSTIVERVSSSVQALAELAQNLQETVGGLNPGSTLVCPRFTRCPVRSQFLTDPELSARNYVNHFCKSDFETCERKRLGDAGFAIPPGLLPDGYYSA